MVKLDLNLFYRTQLPSGETNMFAKFAYGLNEASNFMRVLSAEYLSLTTFKVISL